MDEYWVCSHCRSLNRAGTGKCYSCKNKYGSKAPEAETLKRPSSMPAAPPPTVTMPTLGAAPPPPAQMAGAPTYIARPALTSVPNARDMAPLPQVQPQRDFRRPQALGAPQGGIAGRLAMHPTLPATGLGYLSAVLLTLLVAGGAVLVLNLLPAASYMLQYMNASDAWGSLSTSQHGTIQTLGIGVGLLSLVTLIVFSLFLGISTRNATGLGADQPLLSPSRAGLCWISAFWAQVRIAIGIIVPALIIWKGYTIPGLIAMVVAVEIAQRNLDDAMGWLERPARHLPDLYAKLGVEGSVASPLASFWSASFRVANMLFIFVAALPAAGLLLSTGSNLAGRTDVIGWRTGGLGIDQLGIALLVGLLAGWAFASIVMLVPLTLGLVQRQRTRKTLVRVGRSRSWVARPGEGTYAPASTRYETTSDDPEDRIIERVPRFAADDVPPFSGVRPPGGPFGGAPMSAPLGGMAAGPYTAPPAGSPFVPRPNTGPFGSPASGGLLGRQEPGVVGQPGTSPFGAPTPSGPFPGQPGTSPFGAPAPRNPSPAPQGSLFGGPPPMPGPAPDDDNEPRDPGQIQWGPDSERIG